MLLKLKKDIQSPVVNYPAGTVKEADFFSHQLGIDIEKIDPLVLREWFEPYLITVESNGENKFFVTFHIEPVINEDDVHKVLWRLAFEAQKQYEQTLNKNIDEES